MKTITLVYHERLGDIIQLFSAAKDLKQVCDYVYIECKEEFHDIFNCIENVYPVPPGYVLPQAGLEHSHIEMNLEIYSSKNSYRMEMYRESGKTWIDFIYGEIMRSFPCVNMYEPQYLSTQRHHAYNRFLPAGEYNLVAPFGVSQHIKVEPLTVIEIAKDLYGTEKPLYILAKEAHPEFDNVIICPRLRMLPGIIRDASNFLGINSAPIIIASGIRASYDYIHIIGDPVMDQDQYVMPNGVPFIINKKILQ